jgi:hypothetical protein
MRVDAMEISRLESIESGRPPGFLLSPSDNVAV